MTDGWMTKGTNLLVSASILHTDLSFSNHSIMKRTRTLIEMMPFGPGARNTVHEVIASYHPGK